MNLNNLKIIVLFFVFISCKHTYNITPKDTYPRFKGYWQIKNDYPFWNPSHTRSTICITTGTNYNLYIDSIDKTNYIIYKGSFYGNNYTKSVLSSMVYDSISNKITISYGKNTQYQFDNLFLNFYTMELVYDTISKDIKGLVGEYSLLNCTDLPGDSFQGNTTWWKQP